MQQPTHDIAKKGGGEGGGEEHPGDSSLFNGEKGRRERGGFILLLPLGGPAHQLAPNPKLAPRPTTDCKRPELHFETAAAYRFPSPLAPKPPPKRIAFHFLESKMRLDGGKNWRGGINHPAFFPVSPPRFFSPVNPLSLPSPRCSRRIKHGALIDGEVSPSIPLLPSPLSPKKRSFFRAAGREGEKNCGGSKPVAPCSLERRRRDVWK